MVLARGILSDGDGKTVGDDDEMTLLVAEVELGRFRRHFRGQRRGWGKEENERWLRREKASLVLYDVTPTKRRTSLPEITRRWPKKEARSVLLALLRVDPRLPLSRLAPARCFLTNAPPTCARLPSTTPNSPGDDNHDLQGRHYLREILGDLP